MADEITLDEEEIKSVRVLYTDLVESLPCLCEVCPWIYVCQLLFQFVSDTACALGSVQTDSSV